MGDEMNQTRSDELQSSIKLTLIELLHQAAQTNASDHRVILQGDRGYLVVKSGSALSEPLVIAAAGRALKRKLDESEAQRLYDAHFRRKNAALSFERTAKLDSSAEREALATELLALATELYCDQPNTLTCTARTLPHAETPNKKLVDAIRTLSVKRDMPSRQKVYWAVLRAEVWLALAEPPPSELTKERGRASWVEAGLRDITHVQHTVTPRDFKEITGYRSLGIFSDQEALELVDPRGVYRVALTGRLAIELAHAQGWDSLLINPRSAVGGELYKNELTSIIDGLARMGW